MQPEAILDFWFTEAAPRQWFTKDAAFDEKIRARFSIVYEAAARGELASWRSTPRGRLAEILVLDQFPRSIYRGTAEAFATDAMALERAWEAIAAGDDTKLTRLERQFLYLPFMHSESRAVHKEAFWLFASLLPWIWKPFFFELAHKKVIDRFGRFPHRNQILGRVSTKAEETFLQGHKGW